MRAIQNFWHRMFPPRYNLEEVGALVAEAANDTAWSRDRRAIALQYALSFYEATHSATPTQVAQAAETFDRFLQGQTPTTPEAVPCGSS